VIARPGTTLMLTVKKKADTLASDCGSEITLSAVWNGDVKSALVGEKLSESFWTSWLAPMIMGLAVVGVAGVWYLRRR